MLTEQDKNKTLRTLIGHAHEGMAKAAHIVDSHRKQAEAVEALIPQILEALENSRKMDYSDRSKVASWLRNPVSAAQYMLELVKSANTDSGSLGHASRKTAQAQNMSSSERNKADALERLREGLAYI